MNFIEELEWRGLLKDVTNKEAVSKRLETPITVYCGFDPTANSLHVGHLQQLILLKRYQLAGHRPLALLGGATGMIGDPRPTSERSMIDEATLNGFVQGIGSQIENILSSDNNPVKVVNNRDWLEGLTILDFLRDYGKHFSVSTMLAKDTIASRLSTGISFTEFSYTILQAIDFHHLYKTEGVQLQFGGSDQWGNLVSGTELIRKLEGHEAEVYGITSPLILKSDGSKFGKSEGKNVWLDAELTDPYNFYQFWINTPDDAIMNYMKRLSLKPVEEIIEIEKQFLEAPHQRLAQRELAQEVTELVHGEEGLKHAQKLTDALFSDNIQSLTAKEIRNVFASSNTAELAEDMPLVDALVETKVVSSKREARQMMQDGAIHVNGEQIKDLEFVFTKDNAIENQVSVIRRGKKHYFLVQHTA